MDVYRQAIGHQRIAFGQQPQVPQYRRFLGNHYGNLANSLRALGRADESAAAVREYRVLWPEDPGELYNSARWLSRCIPIASTPEHAAALATEAVDWLRTAVDLGWSDAAKAAREPDLDPLRGREDFRRLLYELLDRAFPADPFTAEEPGASPTPPAS